MQLQVVGADGKVLLARKMEIVSGTSIVPVNIAALQSGNYFVKITSAEDEQRVVKFSKR